VCVCVCVCVWCVCVYVCVCERERERERGGGGGGGERERESHFATCYSIFLNRKFVTDCCFVKSTDSLAQTAVLSQAQIVWHRLLYCHKHSQLRSYHTLTVHISDTVSAVAM